MGLTDVLNIVAASVLSVGGAGAIMVALSKFVGERVADRWLAGVKAGYAKQLAHVEHELDQLGKRHQAQLDHSVTVSRVQFEKEFQCVREIWQVVTRARASAVAIVERTAPVDDTTDKQLARFVAARKKFAEDQSKLVVAIDDNSPFYPQAIYAAVDAFRRRTTLELTQLHTRTPLKQSEWFDQREAAHAEIIALAELVSLTIRQRLASIVIQEGPGQPVPDVEIAGME
jgi:hypothetical protein